MRQIRGLLANRKIRFVCVGILNTLLNFLVLNFAFFVLKQNKFVASLIATLFAVVISFFLNRGFVFHNKSRSLRQPLLFAAVTLTGVLIFQNAIYGLFVVLLRSHTAPIRDLIHSVSGVKLSTNFIDINLSNLISSLFAMIWNYNGYRLFVFKEGSSISDEIVEIPT